MLVKYFKKWMVRLLNSTLLILFLSAGCSGPQQRQNRLQFASSPYLKAHADNPVDWYEWGNEALDKAKKENKPLLISIGYASCHWCHEMEKESFMDTAVARIMNENFICVKVDREERPDIDNIYMDALQLLSGNTGWPLHAFALPDGKPFFAGTYYPKDSWTSLLLSVARSYTSKHKLVETQANALLNGIAGDELRLIDSGSLHAAPLQSLYAGLYDSIYKTTDLINGGLKGRQKFPTPALPEFMLQHFYVTGNKEALSAATTTLKKMALGGIYDQAGGGFARYATDSMWRIPHFEKMLYDNGQILSLYAHAFQLTKDEFYKTILVETLAFIEKNLAAPEGGYYSSLNADTEEGEGKYYAWNENTFLKTVGYDTLLAAFYHVSRPGNWKPGYNLLYASQTPTEFAIDKKTNPAAFITKLNSAKINLQKERNTRPGPVVDTKIITAWNSILLKGYADAYAATGTEDYLVKARSCASFIENNMLSGDGSLKRNFKDGKALIEGFLDDYAWTAAAFTRLYEVSFDTHWITLARRVTHFAIKNFLNSKTGLFYYTGSNAPQLVLRKIPVADEDIPSANAVMAGVLHKLGTIYYDTAYTKLSLTMFASVSGRVKEMPGFHIQWCSFAERIAAKSYEVVVMGEEALKKNKELQQYYLPTSIITGSAGEESLPLMKNKLTAGKTLIYVCTDRLCKRPEEETANAVMQIK